MKQKLSYIALVVLVASGFSVSPQLGYGQAAVIRPLIFPVIGSVSYFSDFGLSRSGGRVHEGNDLMGRKMMPLVAVADGTVGFVNYPEPSWGYAISIRDSEGYSYWYLHMNNDNPGTDDGKGDGFFAYAPDIQPGSPVAKGQLVGWMGDSGNAEGTTAHLHFEMHDTNGQPMDPYPSLKVAQHITAPVTQYPKHPSEIVPYDYFTGGMSAASGNFDTDSAVEVATGAGPSGGPLVRVFEKDGTAKPSFYAYDPRFKGGIDIAAADVDGDGMADIITAPDAGGGPHIKVFKSDGTVIKEFMAYDPRFKGGVRVAAADLDADGKAEIVTAPGPGGGPHVRVFKSDGTVRNEFMAYDPRFHGGIDVAASSNGIATAPGPGGGPHLKVFTAVGSMQSEFMAYDPNFHGGVKISAGSAIATVPASGGGPHLKTFNFSGTELSSQLAGFEVWWKGGYDVTVGSDGAIFMAAGTGRRASLRPSTFSTGRNFGRFPRGD